MASTPFYIKRQQDFVKNLTAEQHKKLAQKYFNPDKMVNLIVGEVKTRLKILTKLGFGKPTLLDKKGKR